MPAPVSASAGVARPLTPLGVKLAPAVAPSPALPLAAPARRPPPAPPAGRLPVVRHPFPSRSPARRPPSAPPQLAALPVVLHPLPSAGCRARRPPPAPLSLPPCPSSSSGFGRWEKAASNYGPVLSLFGQSSRKKVLKSAAFCHICTVSRAKTVSSGKPLYEV